MKVCSKCSKNKALKEYYAQTNICKECTYGRKVKRRQTKKGLAKRIYRNQVGNSKQHRRIPPTYTEHQFQSWLFAQENFDKLYNAWVLSNYNKDLIPSVDRIQNHIGYTFENIQLMTWLENEYKK